MSPELLQASLDAGNTAIAAQARHAPPGDLTIRQRNAIRSRRAELRSAPTEWRGQARPRRSAIDATVLPPKQRREDYVYRPWTCVAITVALSVAAWALTLGVIWLLWRFALPLAIHLVIGGGR